MDNKIILVGKQNTENSDEIEEGYVQVEFNVDELLGNIDTCDVRSYAKDKFDLIPMDELDDCDEDDLVRELDNRGYNFLSDAKPEAMVNRLEMMGYKVLDDYDDEYYNFLKVSNLDVQDMNMLKEITKRFLDASVFEKENIYKAVHNHDYLLSLDTKLKKIIN